MWNKQLITFAIVPVLCCAVQVEGAKPAKSGGGNHMQRGIELAQQKHYDAATEEFGKAIEQNPKDPRGYANRGTAYRQGARTAMAAGDSQGASTRYQAALAYRSMKNYDAAIADYTFLITTNPNDLEALTKRGYTYSLAQQYENAIPDYQAVLKVNPQDNDTFQRLQYAQSM